MKLHVATYNIHKGVSVLRGLPRIHAQKQAIGKLGAQLIFLQEVQGRLVPRHGSHGAKPVHHASNSQHLFLAGNEYQVAYGMNAKYLHGHHGNALLSTFPIVSMSNRDISDHALEQRGILHCKLYIGNQMVHCFVTHFGLFERSRLLQTKVLIETVNEVAKLHEPIIIAGDFNDWRNRLSCHLQDSLDVVEVFHALGCSPAKTFPAMMPLLRLDRIYVRGFSVDGAQALSGHHWGRLSDHAPILAHLNLETNP